MKSNITPGIPDDMFIRGDVPVTKEEIRTITVSKLRLKKDSNVIDIGAGTGSVSIEAAKLLDSGYVYAVERNEKAIQLINKNIKKFEIDNIKVIHGSAPDALKDIDEFDRAFIGGSGGKLAEILKWIDERLIVGGRIVINAITLETLIVSKKFFNMNYYSIEIIQVAVTKCEDIGEISMLKALNPVFIISAQKNRDRQA